MAEPPARARRLPSVIVTRVPGKLASASRSHKGKCGFDSDYATPLSVPPVPIREVPVNNSPASSAKTIDAPKVGFVSLGCPKALVDSEQIITQLRAEGYEISGTYDGAGPRGRQHLRFHRRSRCRRASTRSARRSTKTAR